MANKHYDYSTPAEYVYDSDKIEVSGGLATLKEGLTNVYAHWMLNESSGTNVPDSSGNGRNGTTINSPLWVAGKLNNCLQFSGSNYVNCGDIANFERTDSFSAELWFKRPILTMIAEALIGRASGTLKFNGWNIRIDSGDIAVFLISDFGMNNYIYVRKAANYYDGNWHHLVVTYNGSNVAAGIKVYFDNSELTMTVIRNTLTASILNTAICSIASMGGTLIKYTGYIDEAVIYNKVLSPAEVSYRYNSGIGRENFYYYSDKPEIKPIASWEVSGVSDWFAFNEILGGGNEGNIGYNLSDDDGVTWYYWNGSAWVSGGDEDHYNSAAVVGANIEDFPIANEKILFRAFLISDGTQKCELDNNEIVATTGNPPNVYAGTNKTCKDHQTIKPFSDAVISDPDGDIENAHAYYDIEGSGFIEIPKGGYGTLQDAIRNFEYTFDNLGVINCILKIIDEELYENQDDLDVTVSKYTKIINVLDSVTGEHLVNFLFDPDDGTTPIYHDSPFSYSWEYGTYDVEISDIGYYDKAETITVENEDAKTFSLVKYTLLATCEASIGLMGCTDTISIIAWLEINGSRIITPTNCEIELKDNNGVTQYHPAINSSPTIEGAFLFNKTPSELATQGVYYLHVTICYNCNYYSSIVAVNELDKDLSVNVEAIKERTDNLPDDPASETNATSNKEEIITETEGISLDLSNLDTEIKRILGLTQENFRITSTTYNAAGLLTSATTKIYPTKADCDANTNPIATYLLTAVYDAENNCTSYKMTRES
jgi:hypothetical protein